MASPRERDHRAPTRRPGARPHPPQVERPPSRYPDHRQYYHDAPPWAQQRYHDYVYVDRSGWWPRWFPYWDPRWQSYWWSLYDYYGGDSRPDYAAYARDAVLRQYAPQWGLVISGSGGDAIVRDHRGGGMTVRDHRDTSSAHLSPSPVHRPPTHASPSPVHVTPPEHHAPRPHYEHPHYYYRDYVAAGGYWWPRWFPYWDAAWSRYWWQLYHYYGGDAYPDYALYAVDATLRALAHRFGWL